MYDGKKVFFILPHEIVREHLVKVLSDNEYEVYLVNDQKVLDSLSDRFPDSIIYINVDSSLNEKEWKEKISSLLEKHPGLLVGVLSGRITDDSVARSYIMDAGVMAGVILLRQGVQECSATMLKVLEANEARGRRKYLRYKCMDPSRTSLNFNWLTHHVIGNILDISSVGLSCTFDDPMDFAKNQVIPGVQLKLGATLLTTDCIVIGSRDDQGTMIYVFLFRTNDDKQIRSKIRQFINLSLQRDLEKSLA